MISMLERNERGLPAQAHTVMVEGVWNPGKTLREVLKKMRLGGRAFGYR